jgi:hypothetical protein
MTDATLSIQSDFMQAPAMLSTAWRPGLKSAALRARRQLYRTWGSVGFAPAPWYCDHGRRGGFPIGWSKPPPSCVGCSSNLPVVGQAVIAACPHGATSPNGVLGEASLESKAVRPPCSHSAAVYGVEVSRESKTHKFIRTRGRPPEHKDTAAPGKTPDASGRSTGLDGLK